MFQSRVRFQEQILVTLLVLSSFGFGFPSCLGGSSEMEANCRRIGRSTAVLRNKQLTDTEENKTHTPEKYTARLKRTFTIEAGLDAEVLKAVALKLGVNYSEEWEEQREYNIPPRTKLDIYTTGIYDLYSCYIQKKYPKEGELGRTESENVWKKTGVQVTTEHTNLDD